jgi:hypothetical protein
VSPVQKEHVQGEEAVLQCGFESIKLTWNVHNGNDVDIIAADGATIDDSKYSVSKNPPLTGLYYRLHILNVGVSDIKKYKCEAVINRVIQMFYLQLIIIGRCNLLIIYWSSLRLDTERFGKCTMVVVWIM